MHILQSLQVHSSIVQSLICFLNNFNDVAFLIVLGTNSQIFRARKDMVSVPKYTERMYVIFKVELFLRV